MAATIASTFAASRPSEKFGTHSISRFIVSVSCFWGLPSCSAAWACGREALGAHTRRRAFSPRSQSPSIDRSVTERLAFELRTAEKPGSPLPHKPDKSGYPRRYDQGIVGVEAACLPQDRHRNKNDPQQCIKIFFEEAFGLRWPDFRKFQSSDGLARIASS